MHEKRSADELPSLIDWDKLASELASPVGYVAPPGGITATQRLPDSLRHAKHVGKPHAGCAVCVAKGLV